ncbi:hypothetical protein EC991_011069 [Linnemannia zychae]|nr:hypothetical protein EC991_011069 [Linnemannia zychae]
MSVITAFDNSLVADNIFQYLSPKDISVCLEVCKAFNTLGQPYLWRTIAHYYTHYHDPWDTVRLPYQRWEPSCDDQSSVNKCYATACKVIHINPRSAYILSTQKKLIQKNAFRIWSLKIDYSAKSLLDVPFPNLTQLTVNCRYTHTTNPLLNNTGERMKVDLLLQERVLELIPLCPILRQLKVSFMNSRQPEKAPFAIRLCQALQYHQPRSAATSSVNVSNLNSLTLIIHGCQSYSDVCSIAENCPPELKELMVQSIYRHNVAQRRRLERGYNLGTRLATMKNNNKENSTPTANDANLPQERIPALQLLNVSWYSESDGQELDVVNTDFFFFPFLSCFPALQDLTVPKIPCRLLKGGSALVSLLSSSFSALTTIDFGENLLAEDQMFRLITSLSKPLQGLSMRITPAYLDRVLPTLLQLSGPTTKVLRLCEMGFNQGQNRSTYIADILASYPQLKTFVVLASPGKVKSVSKIRLQDLLRTGWVCSRLEKLSISIDEIVTAPTRETDAGCNGLVTLTLDEEERQDKETNLSIRTEQQQLVLYADKVHLVSEVCRRLKALRYLTTLELQWGPNNYAVPYECGLELSDNLLTVDNLAWMGLI